jgi:hypothetical protein
MSPLIIVNNVNYAKRTKLNINLIDEISLMKNKIDEQFLNKLDLPTRTGSLFP